MEACEAERRITIARRWLQSVIDCRGQSAHTPADMIGFDGQLAVLAKPPNGTVRALLLRVALQFLDLRGSSPEVTDFADFANLPDSVLHERALTAT